MRAFGILVLALAAVTPAVAQQRMPAPTERPTLDPVRGTQFACAPAGTLNLQLVTRNAELVAVVDAGAGQHVLPLKPWKVGDVPQITWSDGVHTLTWNPGVQLMWMDGPVHRDCGRSGGGHQH